MEELVLIEHRIGGADGLIGVTLNRPEKLNALSGALIAALTSAFTALSHDDGMRCVVLKGNGRAFSAGVDVAELWTITAGSAEAFIDRLHGACRAVRECPVPVIARIDGACMGGALELAASCDLRAASRRSSFAMPEVRIGLPSVIEAALLPRLMGWGRAADMVLTGRVLDGEEAHRAGLIEAVTDDDELDAAVARWTNAILAAGPKAIRLQKSLMRRWETSDTDAAIAAGISAFRDAHATNEPRRMLEAMLARRGERNRD